MKAEKYLGFSATDKVTGLKGVITTVSKDLTGCSQCVLTPKATKEGTIPEGHWMDFGRLIIGKEVCSPNSVETHDGVGAMNKPLP